MEIKYLGLIDYKEVYDRMLRFCGSDNFKEQIWVLEHFPVYTLGKVCNEGDLLFNNINIPVVKTDRGGKITYHGPGQLVIYPLIRFSSIGIGVKSLVLSIEESIIDTLGYFGLDSYVIDERPGVYIEGKKIASIGIRISKDIIYHGLSLNIDMDLTPFDYINPCGYSDLRMTQMVNYLDPCPHIEEVMGILLDNLMGRLKV